MTGETTLNVMVLASPEAEVRCVVESLSRTNAVVPQRVVTFAANSPARSVQSIVIAGVKDVLTPEDVIRFTLAVDCRGEDIRFDTAAASIRTYISDVQFPQISSIQPALTSFVGQVPSSPHALVHACTFMCEGDHDPRARVG